MLDKTKEENQKLNQEVILAKVEVSSLTEKLATKAESEKVLKEAKIELEENLQSECNKLKGQIQDFERIKERSGLLQEMLDKTKEENQKLNQEVILAKVEVSSLTEKLATKVESEKVLKEARIKLEENLQTMQAKCENLAIQLESTKGKLESKLEKIDSIETQNKELHKQVDELTLKVSQQQTQIQVEQTVHEQAKEQQAKEQQKHTELQEKISSLEESLKQLQESIFTLHVKVTTKSALKSVGFDDAKTPVINLHGCTKEVLIKTIEVHVDQIEELHQQIHMYKRKILELQQKLKCVSLYL